MSLQLVQRRAAALDVAADGGAQQADPAFRDEAVAQQHRTADFGILRGEGDAGSVRRRIAQRRSVAFQVAAEPGPDQADRALCREAVAQQHRPADGRMVGRQRNAATIGSCIGQTGAVAFQAAADTGTAQADGALGGEAVAQQDGAAHLGGVGGQHHALAVLGPVHQPSAVHVERAGDPGTHQPDHPGSHEAVSHDDDAVEASGLRADSIPLPGADTSPARHHVAGHVRGVQRDATDSGEPSHQIQAAADLRPRQPQRIPSIPVRDTLPRRRDLQSSTARQQIALDHRGMRVDPGRLGQRRRLGDIERSGDPHAARPDLADAALA